MSALSFDGLYRVNEERSPFDPSYAQATDGKQKYG